MQNGVSRSHDGRPSRRTLIVTVEVILGVRCDSSFHCRYSALQNMDVDLPEKVTLFADRARHYNTLKMNYLLKRSLRECLQI